MGKEEHNEETCRHAVKAVRDALYVLSGKWKLPLIMALRTGPLRFNDLQRITGGITPRILSKELKELELNGFIERKVVSTSPVTVVYERLPYSDTLKKVLQELQVWGHQHRQRIMRPSLNNQPQA